MKTMNLGISSLQVPVIATGCWRMSKLNKQEAELFVQTSIEAGANFFDHADVYGDGVSEEKFADAVHMNSTNREKIILQSKCGIRMGIAYDFSKEHILSAVDGSLKRLKTDYLDMLLLHRPDALVEPEEVAEAFDVLHGTGKVRNFGVSNQNPMQIQLLKKFVKQPILVNQLQLSITNATMISQGLHVNMLDDPAVSRDGSVLDFCRLNDITIQTWSPFQYGFFAGVYLGNPKFSVLNAKIDEIAAQYGVSNTTTVIAWLLRHPANMQPVIGTMNVERLLDCTKAADIRLTREDWYKIYFAGGNDMP
jgi:predicted oxidoreductase